MNFARQIAVAFYGWCVKTGRAESNPLRVVPKQDETRDRRRVSRPLTDDEMTRLLRVARERGRDAWYLAAALAGLRKGDTQRLTCGDVNFAESTVTIRHGKAKRPDVIDPETKNPCNRRGFLVILRDYRQSGRRDLNPRRSAWKADALPLSYTRNHKL